MCLLLPSGTQILNNKAYCDPLLQAWIPGGVLDAEEGQEERGVGTAVAPGARERCHFSSPGTLKKRELRVLEGTSLRGTHHKPFKGPFSEKK